MIDATIGTRWRASILAAVLIAGGMGYWLGRPGSGETSSASPARKVLYYYDPMVPQEHYQDPAALS